MCSDAGPQEMTTESTECSETCRMEVRSENAAHFRQLNAPRYHIFICIDEIRDRIACSCEWVCTIEENIRVSLLSTENVLETALDVGFLAMRIGFAPMSLTSDSPTSSTTRRDLISPCP